MASSVNHVVRAEMNRHQRRAQAKLGWTAKTAGSSFIPARLVPAADSLFKTGVDHYQAGQFNEAEDCYRRALGIQPGHPGILCNLGAVLHKQSKLDEAIAVYRDAIRINPRYALPHANLGSALKDQGKLEEAISSFRAAVRFSPDYQDAHFHLGLALHAQRKFADAASAFQQAVKIKPDYAEAYCHFGIALYEQGKFDEAIAAQRAALRIEPDFASAYYNLGLALYQRGRLDDAVSAYEDAIAAKPDYTDAHNGLGIALMDLGRLSEARGSLEEAVRLAPQNAKYWRDAGLVTRFVAGDPRLAAMEELMKERAARPINEQIELHFALGKAYDDVAQYADAFRHWLEGNALKRRHIDYDEAATLAEMSEVGSAFTAELIQSSQGAGNPSSIPIFIVGMPRSGSTLIEQILSSHPKVHGGGELSFFRKAVEDTLVASSGSVASRDDIRQIGDRYLREVEQLAPKAAHITDKLPRNFIFSGLIHVALPNAPIIHTMRDPIDTCLSCFSISFGGEQDFAYDLAELGRYYRRYASLMKHWHRLLPPGRILDVRYEDVVADPECQIRRILAHCGLDWDSRCLDFHKTERAVRTASNVQVREQLHDRAVARWRHYADFLEPLIAEINDTKSD
jgi:tetratricopeptide (TPR) repeat protein